MNRLTRITSILIKLQSKSTLTAQEIADEFDISLRTVYRDVKTLQEAGVPIGSEAGIGYFMVDGYRLPPVSFAEDEANALVTAEKFVLQNMETSLVKNYRSALTKIKAVLRTSEKDKVALLESRISPARQFNKEESSSYLAEVQKAITSFEVIDITYRDPQGITTQRKVDPLGLYFTENRWVMVAYCRFREDYRDFRLDRILDLKPTDITSGKAITFNLQDHFKKRGEKYS
ncbi:helix-turn-helix transcriptional regulator [Flagellimonas algicola]|uniref:YafY family transcriptional regulator n=1 Tax=Flagellimonas algicola TaxID=2583815 RepID=A0ABY2WQ99_9FLAO|nr:YafY family protein [Allomuricauda algicola]TMU56905.1 YafY family transcriptional regulator [Allomuricauda algicola]